MKLFKLFNVTLNLFDGAAAAGGDGGAGAGTAANGGAQGETTGQVPANTRRGKTGEFDNVVFGKQMTTDATEGSSQAAADETAKTDVKTTSSTLEDKRKAFQDLVNGDYKDIYTEEIQRIINRRFKETATLRQQVEQYEPLIETLRQHYNIKDGDVKKIMEALDNDNAYWSEAADEAGMSVEQYKAFQKLQRDNAALLKAEEARRGQQFAQNQAQKWYQESEELKKKFPKFDLGTELQSDNFRRMIQAGTPIEHAYKVIHYDELMQEEVMKTAANAQKAVIDNVRARGARPQEVGTTGQSAFTIKDDVSKLTKKERAEIARRVARGETISF